MIGFGSIAKWVAIAAIVSAIGVGINKGYNIHLDTVDAAVVAAQKDLAIASATRLIAREDELREQSIVEKSRICNGCC